MKTSFFSAPRRLVLSATVTAATAWMPMSHAQATSPVIAINEATAKADIQVEQVRDGISVLSGSGGNIVVLDSKGGKFLVDAGIAVSKDKLTAALKQISPAPLKYVVDTHWHWDHTDGNTWMHEAGATIIAHPNTLKHLSEETRVEDWNYTFKPLPAAGLPTILVEKDKTMNFGGSKIQLQNFGHGHTDGDLWVYFDKADVLVLGDTFWNGYYPFIDNADGGGINQAIHWVDEAIKHTSDHTVVVPGHGPVGNRAQLAEFHDMLVTIRDNVQTLKRQGKSLDEIIAAKPTAAYDAKFGGFVINGDFFTKLVYAGL
ncbi:MBL fold metallo-hydrolase [Dyella soli]|uniref:MBL fold metallo-hydrolase n=1 Tax=Dyella soli TaxID=522319 RepID=A0A4V2NLR4_9GAMM|nr:MBL fold metallo-hydrolase [Dyella soli]TCI10151.1 MBL fold metallo-hydrolase [Dyella soli]